jgi:hypothetical protein
MTNPIIPEWFGRLDLFGDIPDPQAAVIKRPKTMRKFGNREADIQEFQEEREMLERQKEQLTRDARRQQDLNDELEDEVIDHKRSHFMPSTIILLAMSTNLILQQLAGLSFSSPFGVCAWVGSPTDPYRGDCFTDGAQHLRDVNKELTGGVPRRWRGVAADDHKTINQQLIEQVTKMAGLDSEMQRLVSDHAETVHGTQWQMGPPQLTLLVAYPIIRFWERADYWRSYWWCLGVARALAASTVGTCLGLAITCSVKASHTASAVNALDYGGVLAKVQELIPQSSSGVAAPRSSGSGSVAPEFPQLSGAFVSSGSGTPSVASSAGVAGGVGPQRPLRDGSPGEERRVGVDAAQVAESADRGAPVAPAPSMPSVAQVGQPLGQVANLSGGSVSPGSASPSNRVNAQGQRGAGEEVVRAGEGEDIAAGSGAQGAERAPIDVAAAEAERAPTTRPAPTSAP